MIFPDVPRWDAPSGKNLADAFIEDAAPLRCDLTLVCFGATPFFGFGKCPILGILNITFKYLLEMQMGFPFRSEELEPYDAELGTRAGRDLEKPVSKDTGGV